MTLKIAQKPDIVVAAVLVTGDDTSMSRMLAAALYETNLHART